MGEEGCVDKGIEVPLEVPRYTIQVVIPPLPISEEDAGARTAKNGLALQQRDSRAWYFVDFRRPFDGSRIVLSQEER